MQFLEAFLPALQLGAALFPFAFKPQARIGEGGSQRDMAAMDLLAKAWRRSVQLVKHADCLAPLAIEPWLMDLFLRMKAALIDMREQHIAKSVGNRFQLFGLKAFFGIARENLVARHAVQILRDHPAVEDCLAVIENERRNLAERIGADQFSRFGVAVHQHISTGTPA